VTYKRGRPRRARADDAEEVCDGGYAIAGKNVAAVPSRALVGRRPRIGLLAAGCGGAIPSSNGGPATVKLMQGQDGRVLVDNKGHSLYLFEKDESAESYCNGACAAVWPPYETESTPTPAAASPPPRSERSSAPTATFR
jgi:predicted lipoprotein with Yx(FWY)xxD motif